MFHSETAKELAKWEQHPTKYVAEGLQPGNPYRFVPYPKMVYMARQTHSGKWAVTEQAPPQFGFQDLNAWDRACQAAAHFTESCQRIVNSEEEEKRAMEEGWRATPQGAMEWRESLEKAIGQAAAERNYRDRSMGEKAKEEAAQVEAETFGHVAEIPEAKRRGRPRKDAA